MIGLGTTIANVNNYSAAQSYQHSERLQNMTLKEN